MRARVRTGAGWRVGVPAILLVLAATAGCSTRGGAAAAYPELQPFAGREIEDVSFTGRLDPFDADTLARLTETRATHCRLLGLPFCIPFTDIGEQEEQLSLERVQADVERLTLFYRQSGFFGTRVEVDVEPVDPDVEDAPVQVEFEVNRADPVVLRSLEVEGLEGVIDSAALPSLPSRVGGRFDLGDFLASGDSVLSMMRRRGHAYAEVLRNYSVDTIADAATASLQAIPGPVVRLDSILIRGGEQLGRATVLRQLGIGQGDLLRSSQLQEGQRNLFLLELVQFASVGLAPDSLQVAPDDSTRATVLVQITEGPVHVVEAALGWGSVSCFRTETSWVSRSLGGGARRLGLSGRVSKIGLGGPNSAQVAEGICKAYDDDPFGNELDYRLSADFSRPYFLNPRNQLSVQLFAERLSEPTVFQRSARGGRGTLTRRFRNQDVGTFALGAERTRLDASSAVFCLALLVCQRDDIQQLLAPRWRIGPEASWARDHTNRPLNPTAGYQARTTGAWITPVLGSDLNFVRITGQGALYRELRPGWVAAGQVRLGSFLGTAELGLSGDEDDTGERVIPPDERFFAGGASSVRGFEQNALGPGVWVDDDPEDETNPPEFIPVGGTSVVTASAEVRLPSPVLSRYLRGAVFVDAGAVGELGDLTSELRITPGVGVRIQTPVGPVRLDVAYNPYGAVEGPLYVVSREDDLVRVEETFTRERGFWDRLQFHIAVGQAF